MKYHIIQSGSKGNATLIENNNQLILIDFGITRKALLDALNKIGYKEIDIVAILITHLHSDHIKGLKYLNPIPIYTTTPISVNNEINIIDYNKSFNLIDLIITPLKTYHDCNKPCGFIIEDDIYKLTYITDTGKVTDAVKNQIKNSTFYLLESNYDSLLLKQSLRPQSLKDRISSQTGHLSNESCSTLLSELINDITSEITFMHISQDTNNHETVYENIYNTLNNKNINYKHINIRCAFQFKLLSGGK